MMLRKIKWIEQGKRIRTYEIIRHKNWIYIESKNSSGTCIKMIETYAENRIETLLNHRRKLLSNEMHVKEELDCHGLQMIMNCRTAKSHGFKKDLLFNFHDVINAK